jgi:hypothetical protein
MTTIWHELYFTFAPPRKDSLDFQYSPDGCLSQTARISKAGHEKETTMSRVKIERFSGVDPAPRATIMADLP